MVWNSRIGLGKGAKAALVRCAERVNQKAWREILNADPTPRLSPVFFVSVRSLEQDGEFTHKESIRTLNTLIANEFLFVQGGGTGTRARRFSMNVAKIRSRLRQSAAQFSGPTGVPLDLPEARKDEPLAAVSTHGPAVSIEYLSGAPVEPEPGRNRKSEPEYKTTAADAAVSFTQGQEKKRKGWQEPHHDRCLEDLKAVIRGRRP
jgi:hypothetical protein